MGFDPLQDFLRGHSREVCIIGRGGWGRFSLRRFERPAQSLRLGRAPALGEALPTSNRSRIEGDGGADRHCGHNEVMVCA